jgi:hypothetical protein
MIFFFFLINFFDALSFQNQFNFDQIINFLELFDDMVHKLLNLIRIKIHVEICKFRDDGWKDNFIEIDMMFTD